jgi:HEAT repeat protein
MQQGAYSALAILGPQAKAAVPALRHQVETSTQSGATYLALMVLGTIGQDALPTILEVLRNPANPNRGAAILALGQMNLGPILDENVTSTLISCLDDANADVALRAGGILCSHKFDQEVVMRIFTAAVQANNKHIRQEAAMPIRVCLMQAFSVPTLLELLRDTNSPYSPDAAAVLGNMLPNDIQLPDTVGPALIGSLRDPRTSVRKHAATAVGNLREGAEPAVSSLLDLWHDPDDAVRQNATNALYQIPAYTVLKDVSLLDNITTEPARTKWIQQYMTDTPAPQLTQLFQHRDPRVREMATNAVQKLRNSLDGNQAAATPSR